MESREQLFVNLACAHYCCAARLFADCWRDKWTEGLVGANLVVSGNVVGAEHSVEGHVGRGLEDVHQPVSLSADRRPWRFVAKIDFRAVWACADASNADDFADNSSHEAIKRIANNYAAFKSCESCQYFVDVTLSCDYDCLNGECHWRNEFVRINGWFYAYYVQLSGCLGRRCFLINLLLTLGGQLAHATTKYYCYFCEKMVVLAWKIKKCT